MSAESYWVIIAFFIIVYLCLLPSILAVRMNKLLPGKTALRFSPYFLFVSVTMIVLISVGVDGLSHIIPYLWLNTLLGVLLALVFACIVLGFMAKRYGRTLFMYEMIQRRRKYLYLSEKQKRDGKCL